MGIIKKDKKMKIDENIYENRFITQSSTSFETVNSANSMESTDQCPEMATLSRESRTSLDSGFDENSKSKKRKNQKIKMKSKKEKKISKNDISKPLGDLKHMAHIGSSGHSFGDISADLTNAVRNSDCITTGRESQISEPVEKALDKIKKSAALMEQSNATSASLTVTMTPSIS